MCGTFFLVLRFAILESHRIEHVELVPVELEHLQIPYPMLTLNSHIAQSYRCPYLCRYQPTFVPTQIYLNKYHFHVNALSNLLSITIQYSWDMLMVISNICTNCNTIPYSYQYISQLPINMQILLIKYSQTAICFLCVYFVRVICSMYTLTWFGNLIWLLSVIMHLMLIATAPRSNITNLND